MGNCWRKIYRKFESSSVLIIGLDGAGKTTLLYKLCLGVNVDTISTIHSNVEKLTHNGKTLRLVDMGGHEKIRPLWRHQYSSTHAVIFVIDTNDSTRYADVKLQLDTILMTPELQGKPILVCYNKWQLSGIHVLPEIQNYLNLKCGRHLKCLPVSVHTGSGLSEGLDWIVDQLN